MPPTRKPLHTDLAPIGDDIEPIEVPTEDVEMTSEEDKEPLEAEVSLSKNESEESHESRKTRT